MGDSVPESTLPSVMVDHPAAILTYGLIAAAEARLGKGGSLWQALQTSKLVNVVVMNCALCETRLLNGVLNILIVQELGVPIVWRCICMSRAHVTGGRTPYEFQLVIVIREC